MSITITLEQIVLIVVGLASFLTAVGVIWNHFRKVKITLEKKLEKAIETIVVDSDKRQDERTELLLKNLRDNLSLEIHGLLSSFTAYTEQYAADKKEEWAIIQLLREGLIESYKKDIRGVYYQLRATGEILDYDKAYIDKIFPKYVAIGGNSDIAAKYEEICRVFERRTQEAYDEAFTNNKANKTKKDKKIVIEKPVEEKKEEIL